MKAVKSKKQKVTLESINENLEKFQLLVVNQFDKIWQEISLLRTEISEISKEVNLMHSDIYRMEKQIEDIRMRLESLERKSDRDENQEQINSLKHELQNVYKILELNGLKIK